MTTSLCSCFKVISRRTQTPPSACSLTTSACCLCASSTSLSVLLFCLVSHVLLRSETMRLEPIWPLFERLFVAFHTHPRVENALCELFANAVAAQKAACAPVLGVLLNVVLQYYSASLQAAPLSVFTAVVSM